MKSSFNSWKNMGKLISIAVKREKRGDMAELRKANISLETGVENDTRGKAGVRQVTIVAAESWKDACADLGIDIPWTARRANLLIEGIELKETVGMFLHVGDAVIEITKETSPCKVMDEAQAGLMNALVADWRGGVLGRVVKEGNVEVGQDVLLKSG